MAKVYFSLGSNEGDRLNSLVKATKLIDKVIGRVMLYSSVIESEPWGFNSETTFFNMALLAETEYTPHQILNRLLDIESSLGRIRHGKVYTNRVIDIDILFYADQKLNDDSLVIPHPLLHLRKFVLQPLNEIAPDLIHPVLNASVAELLNRLKEPNPIPVAADRDEFARLLNSKTRN